MRIVIVCVVILFLSVSFASASSHNENHVDPSYYSEHEKRHDEINQNYDELKVLLRYRIKEQKAIIDEQSEKIEELESRVNKLESDLFQAIQSLRNLELEVWDMKDSLSDKYCDVHKDAK